MVKKVAIIYHSGFGHTKVQAEHVENGVNLVEGVIGELFSTSQAIEKIEQLSNYDAMIFGSPTYMGSVSAQFKEFMEASSKAWSQQIWKDKIAAGFTNSHAMSGDKLNSLVQLNIFAMQHSMVWVGLGEMSQSPDGDPANKDAINRIGCFLGAMAQSENDTPQVTPPSGDLKTAELLGKRVAKFALKLTK
jgi:NAD(P)H dehydrogenase (quinone)